MTRMAGVVVAVALAAGCSSGSDETTDTVPRLPLEPGVSATSEPATVPERPPAPEPTPTGALYGRVMHADGTAAETASVSLWQSDAITAFQAFTAIASLGFFCLFFPGVLCPAAVDADVGETGQYSFTPGQMKDVPGLLIGPWRGRPRGMRIGGPAGLTSIVYGAGSPSLV